MFGLSGLIFRALAISSAILTLASWVSGLMFKLTLPSLWVRLAMMAPAELLLSSVLNLSEMVLKVATLSFSIEILRTTFGWLFHRYSAMTPECSFQPGQILSSSMTIFPRLMLSLTSGLSRFVKMTFMFLRKG